MSFFIYYQEAGRHICAFVCCMLCIGPAAIITGIVFLVMSGDRSRENAVSSYSSIVSAWTESSKALQSVAFAELISDGSQVISGSAANSSTVLSLFTSGPNYQGVTDSNKDGVPQYIGYYFQAAPTYTSPTSNYTLLIRGGNDMISVISLSPYSSQLRGTTQLTRSKSSLNCRTTCSGDTSSSSYKSKEPLWSYKLHLR
jgi:hypothetical protein